MPIISLVSYFKGHVLGLVHEHQRADPSKWLDFKCDSLADYDAVKAALRDGDTMDKVCTDGRFALKYGFSAQDYSTLYYGLGQDLDPKTSTELDTQSIM